MKKKISIIVLCLVFFAITIGIAEVMRQNQTVGYAVSVFAILVILYKFILFE